MKRKQVLIQPETAERLAVLRPEAAAQGTGYAIDLLIAELAQEPAPPTPTERIKAGAAQRGEQLRDPALNPAVARSKSRGESRSKATA